MLRDKSIDEYWQQRHEEMLALIWNVIEESQPPDVPTDHKNRRLVRIQAVTKAVRQLLADTDHHWDPDYDRRTEERT